MIPKEQSFNRPYAVNDAKKTFRNRYRTLDSAKNNKEFDDALPEFLDLFAEDPVLAKALVMFKASMDEMDRLKQHALQQVRENNSKAEAMCYENGIKLPAYRSDLSLLEDTVDPIDSEAFEQLSNITEFQAYEQELLPPSEPLVMRLHFALLKTQLVIKDNGLSVEEEADEHDFYGLWLRLWHEKNGFAIYNLLRLLRDNPYGSVLPREDLPFEILEESCGLKALMKMSLPAPNERDRLAERKLIASRLYFYAQRLYDQLRCSEPEEFSVLSEMAATPLTSEKEFVFKAIITEDSITYSHLKNTEMLSIRFERKTKKGDTSKRADAILKILNVPPAGISKSQLQKQLNLTPQRFSDVLGGINERFNTWHLPRDEQYIPTGSDIRKVRINNKYPTKVIRE